MPIRKPGSALPTRISTGRNGVTSSWSKVPCSRSRATESAVVSMVTSSVMTPMIPGMKNQRLSRLGLNQARVSSRAGREGDPRAAMRSSLKVVTTVRT